MKDLFTWITDVHISLKNLSVSIQVLKESLELARNRKIPLFISGDLNDTKAVMRSEWVNALLVLFHEYSDVEIMILVGNHDLDNKNASTNSLEFLKLLPNVELFSKQRNIFINGMQFSVIPYQVTTDDFRSCLKYARETGVKNLIAHQGVLGAHMGDYIVDESSVNPNEFADFDMVFLGHYHKYQRHLNYMYGGSPFTVNFGEADQRKFIHIVQHDQETGFNVEHYETKARRHVKFVVESEEDVNKIEKVTGSLAQVVIKGPKEFVKKMNNASKFKEIIGADSISIVPEVNKQSEHRISADILHSPIKVIDTYLAGADTVFDKNKLKEFLFLAAQDLLTSFSSNSAKKFEATGMSAKNILSFSELEFEFTPMGLTLIEGFDEDNGIATGAGKSSFMDIFFYGMFGETSKDLKADEIVNRIAKKNAEVEIRLKSTDGNYTIRRYRKHQKFENDLYMILPNGVELRGKDARETQKLIEKELGCGYDLALKSSYFTQFGAIDRFLSSSDNEKKKLVSEITDLSIYDQITEKVKGELKILNADLIVKDKALLQLQTEHDTSLVFIDDMKVKQNQWNIDHQVSINNIERDLSQWDQNRQVRVQNLQQDQLNFESGREARVQDVQGKINSYEIQRSNSIIELQKDVDNFEIAKRNAIITIEAQAKETWDKMEALTAEIKKMESEKQGEEKLRGDLAEVKNKLNVFSNLSSKSMQLNNDLLAIDKEIESIQNKHDIELSKLNHGQDGTCSYCHQSINHNLIEDILKGFLEEIKVLQSKKDPIISDRERINKLLDMKPEVEKQKEELEGQLARAMAVDQVIRTKSNEATSLHNLYKTYADKKANKELEKSESIYQIKLVQERQNPFSNEAENIKKEVNPFNDKVNLAIAEINPYILQLNSTRNQLNPFTESINQKESSMEDLKNKLYSANNEAQSVREKVAFGEWWKQALHVYIKSYLMDSCLDQLNQIVNEYLQTLFDGILQFNISATTEAGKEIKEKIDVSIVNNGDECSYQSLSGGERCRICLAVNLALAQIISKTSGKDFGMIFMDEILNGLDEVGKSQSMKLLKELELQYPSIFIIDHAEGFKSLFSNSLMIKKKDKISTLV